MKIRNPIIIKLLVFIAVIIGISIVSIICYKVVYDKTHPIAYDLGNYQGIYEDKIIKEYDEYIEIMNNYKLNPSLSKKDFENNYFIVSYQEYDPCGESQFKTVDNVEINDNIKVTFKVHNKCGWCKSHLSLYFIPIKKIKIDLDIKYDYVYESTLNCGTIK